MDGLLLRINHDFLLDLQRKGLFASSIRFRFAPRDQIVTGYRTTFKMIKNLEEFNFLYSSVIKDRHYLCYAGPFPVIENIKLVNKNLSFNNEYTWYNITDKRTLVRQILYDSVRKSIYEKEIQRYLNLTNTLFDQYTTNIKNSIDVRLNSYMDPCYVDGGYVSPNSN